MEYGLIGEKLGHSFSKEIHALIADYDYELKELKKEELGSFLEEKNFKGINVTIPYKRDVIPYLDEISPEAEAIGAVNCVVNSGGRLLGYNTDFYGLRELILRTGIDMSGKTVLIGGTGGTSDTAKAVCESLGVARIFKASRSGRRGALTYEEAERKCADAAVFINATPCGMYPDVYKCPISLDSYKSLDGVIDVIYNPLRSELVSAALKRGLAAAGGLYMLVGQAVKAAELFLAAAEKSVDQVEIQSENSSNRSILEGSAVKKYDAYSGSGIENGSMEPEIIDDREISEQEDCKKVSKNDRKISEQEESNGKANEPENPLLNKIFEIGRAHV